MSARPHCPTCRQQLPKSTRLMVIQYRRNLTRWCGPARYCATCDRWLLTLKRLTLFRPLHRESEWARAHRKAAMAAQAVAA